MANAKSVLSVLGACVKCGDEIEIFCDGEDEEAALKAMKWHTVKSGDTLGKIDRNNGTTVNALCRLNGIKSTSTLRIGQKIRVR